MILVFLRTGVLLLFLLICQHGFAATKNLPKYRLLAGDPVTIYFKYAGEDEDAVDGEDDFFDDNGSQRNETKGYECEGGSIVGALNCVTQKMENSGPGDSDNSAQAEESSDNKASSSKEDAISSTLELTLTPKLAEDSQGNYKYTFDVKAALSFSDEESKNQIKSQLEAEAISISNYIELWSSAISQEKIEGLNKRDLNNVTFFLPDEFKAGRLFVLAGEPVSQLEIVERKRPVMVSLKILSDQTNPFFISGGEKDRTGPPAENLFGNSKGVTLLVKLKDFDWHDYGRPDFSDPAGEIDYRAVSYFIEGDDYNQRERDYLFKEWGLSNSQDPELVLVQAGVPTGALSNYKMLEFEDNHRPWELLYADLGANFQFAREYKNGDWRPADFLMVGDRVRIELVFSKAPNIPTIPVWQSQVPDGDTGIDLPLNSGSKIMLSKTGDRKIYASGTIDVTAALWPINRNDKWSPAKHVITIPPNTAKDYESIDSHVGDVLLSVDTDFRGENFLGPVAPMTRSASIMFPVYSSPPDRTLWRDALERTAACEAGFTISPNESIDGIPSRQKGEISRWSVNSLGFFAKTWLSSGGTVSLVTPLDADDVKAAREVEKLWNAQSVQPKAMVSYGHHAALLLLRDELLRSISAQAETLSAIDSDKKLLQVLANMPYSESNPYNVIDIRLPGGEEIAFQELQGGRKHLEKRTNLKGSALDGWIAGEMKRVTQALNVFANDTSRAIVNVDPCDSRALLRLVADVHGPVSSGLIPKLIKPVNQGYQQYWEADKAAINWVMMVSDLAQEVRYRDKEAEVDSTAFQFQTAIAGLVVPGWAGVALDVGDAAYGITSATLKYNQSRENLVVDRGKTLILGAGYFRQAERIATAARYAFQQQMFMTSVSIGLSGATHLMRRSWRNSVGVDGPGGGRPSPDSPGTSSPGEARAPGTRGSGESVPSANTPASGVADQTLPPPRSGSSTEMDILSPKRIREFDELMDDLDDVLPKQADRLREAEAQDIFSEKAGTRVRNIEDKELYLRELEARSARGETLADSELLDKLDLMRLKRNANGGDINRLPDTEAMAVDTLPPTERMEVPGATRSGDDGVYEKGRDIRELSPDPDKTIKVDPGTKDPSEMATEIGLSPLQPNSLRNLPNETSVGLPKGQVDVFENNPGVRLLAEGEKIEEIIAKGARGEKLTADEMLTKVDYLRARKSYESGKIRERIDKNTLTEEDSRVIEVLKNIEE